MLFSLVHQSVIQQQATPGDLPVTPVKTEHVSPAQTTPEQCGDQPEPEMELPSIPPALSSPSASDLVEATDGSSTITIWPIPMPDFRFLDVVPLKILFLKIAPITATPAISESFTTALPQ